MVEEAEKVENTETVSFNSSRGLFGVQLEVTNRLLDAERRRLIALKKELHLLDKKTDVEHRKHLEQQHMTLRRLEIQHDRLEKEYQTQAIEVIRRTSQSAGMRSQRSQPSLGLKQVSKQRPSIFGTLTRETQSLRDDFKAAHRRSLPQTSSLASVVYLTLQSSSNNNNNCREAGNTKMEDVRRAIIYQNDNLISGSLEALIQHVVPTTDYYPDRTYIFAFLLTSRLFIKPHELIVEVCQLCADQQKLYDGVDQDTMKKFGPNIIQLLIEWTETFPYDFRDERMMVHLKELTQRCIRLEPSLRKSSGILMQTLIRKLANLEKYEAILNRVNEAQADRMQLLRANPAAFQTNIIEICKEPVVLAQQLTHIELERLMNIGPEEFVQAFMKKDIEDSKLYFSDYKKTKNLEAYVEWFNRLSYLVATEICMHVKKKHRARLIEYFIDVARECFDIGNFNSLMSILAGLNMSPVSRLRKTWAKVNTAKFDVLESLMNPTSNFSNYRQALKAAMQRAQCASIGGRDRMVIPFFSLLVKDIYFLNEGCVNKLKNGHINFDKFWQLAKQITEFMTWKHVDCPFVRDKQALNYLLTAPVFTENSLYLASYESEHPDNSFEKERYKTIQKDVQLDHK